MEKCGRNASRTTNNKARGYTVKGSSSWDEHEFQTGSEFNHLHMESVNIIPLASSDGQDEQDVFLKSIVSKKPELDQSNKDFTLTLKSTNGIDTRSSLELGYNEIIKGKSLSNNLEDDQWLILLYQLLFNDVQNEEDWDKYEVSGQEREENVWDIKFYIKSHNLRNSLGKFSLISPINPSNDDYDPFQLSLSLQRTRNEAFKERLYLKKKVRELEIKTNNMLKEQTEFYENLQAKQTHQLKVFSQVLNDQQQRYRDLITQTGVKDPCGEVMNIGYIKNIDQDIKHEEQVKTKAKKPKKEKSTKIASTLLKLEKEPKQRPSLIRKTPSSSPKKSKQLSPIKPKLLPDEVHEEHNGDTVANASIIRGINHIKSIRSADSPSHSNQLAVTNNTEDGTVKNVVQHDLINQIEGEEINDSDIIASTDDDEDDDRIRTPDKEVATENDGGEKEEEETEESDFKKNEHDDEDMELRDSIQGSTDVEDLMDVDEDLKKVSDILVQDSNEITPEIKEEASLPISKNIDQADEPTDDDNDEIEGSMMTPSSLTSLPTLNPHNIVGGPVKVEEIVTDTDED